MKHTQFLFALLALFPMTALGAIPYRVEQIRDTNVGHTGNDNQSFARDHRFYIGAAYDFSMWGNGDDGKMHINGKNTSAFDISAGFRPCDTMRIEANYTHTNAKWNAFSMDGGTAFINALVDARIDSLYRIFRKQTLVPYVGIGGGLSWNSADDGVHIDHKISPVAAALAGITVEMGEWFAVDFGYRYFYMFTPHFDIISDYAPTAHQFRAGIRVNF